MPSKTSKPRQAPLRQWKSAQDCAESEILGFARALAPLLNPRDRVLLEGELGVGKTTFARALLEALGVTQPPEGSPSFAIAHEYHSARGPVVHLDLYRLEREDEIEDAGISAYYWERDAIVISEWTAMFPDFEQKLLSSPRGNLWKIQLTFSSEERLRSIEIQAALLSEGSEGKAFKRGRT